MSHGVDSVLVHAAWLHVQSGSCCWQSMLTSGGLTMAQVAHLRQGLRAWGPQNFTLKKLCKRNIPNLKKLIWDFQWVFSSLWVSLSECNVKKKQVCWTGKETIWNFTVYWETKKVLPTIINSRWPKCWKCHYVLLWRIQNIHFHGDYWLPSSRPGQANQSLLKGGQAVLVLAAHWCGSRSFSEWSGRFLLKRFGGSGPNWEWMVPVEITAQESQGYFLLTSRDAEIDAAEWFQYSLPEHLHSSSSLLDTACDELCRWAIFQSPQTHQICSEVNTDSRETKQPISLEHWKWCTSGVRLFRSYWHVQLS